MGFYQVLIQYVQVEVAERNAIPRITDANRLTKRSRSGQPNAWQRRAIIFESQVATALQVPPNQVMQHVNQLMKETGYADLQPHNIIGMAFAALIAYCLEEFGSKNLTYDVEVPAGKLYPGIRLPGRSSGQGSADVVAYKLDGTPRAIITAKWGIRHDRIHDITNECPAYKQAALFRRQILSFYVVTNEMDQGRLTTMAQDDCLEGVVHIHVPMLMALAQNPGNVIDLVDFVKSTHDW